MTYVQVHSNNINGCCLVGNKAGRKALGWPSHGAERKEISNKDPIARKKYLSKNEIKSPKITNIERNCCYQTCFITNS